MKNYILEIKEGLLISLRAIRANKVRSVLTTMGIVIGVTSVVLMSTAIKGIDNSFQNGVASLGSDVIYIDKWEWFNNDIPWWEMRNRKNLDMDDFKAYRRLAKLPIAAAPTVWTNQTMKYKDRTVEFRQLQGTTSEYIKTTNLDFADGRFFNELESNGARNVAVVGSEIAKKLFPYGGGVDRVIKIKGKKYKVIGILKEQGSWVMGNYNPDNIVYVPIGSIFRNFQRESFRSITIVARAANSQSVQNMKEEAIEIMRRVRGLKYNETEDFSINQQAVLLDNINDTVGVIQIAGIFITGLAMFVGAIGIMNIMFVSVKERTREIGIRKAIGAKRRAILGQFISEAAIICLLGGLIGLFLAIVFSMILNQFMPTSIQPEVVILALGISLITGLISGVAPAYTAAKIDPVDALRYE